MFPQLLGDIVIVLAFVLPHLASGMLLGGVCVRVCLLLMLLFVAVVVVAVVVVVFFCFLSFYLLII